MATQKILSPEGRFRFIHVFDTVDNFNGDGKEKVITVLIPKTASLAPFTAARDACAKEEFKGKIPGGLRKVTGGQKPILTDGDEVYASKDEEKQPMYEAYQGCWVFQPKAAEQAPLRILGPDNCDLMDPAELYDGCYGQVVVNLEVYTSKKWGAQCSIKLLGVKKTRDGEPIEGGQSTPKLTDDEVANFFGARLPLSGDEDV